MAAIAQPTPSWSTPHSAGPHKRAPSSSSITFKTPEYNSVYEKRDSFENSIYSSTPSTAGSGFAAVRGGQPHSLKIKPYLKKLSLKGASDSSPLTVDLSKSAAENSSLAGLGFYNHDDSRSGSELAFPSPTFPHSPTHPRGMNRGHQRSTSNNSTFSTLSQSYHHHSVLGGQRTGVIAVPTVPYAHPMRATATPPPPGIQRSHTAGSSLVGGGDSEEDEQGEAVDVIAEDTTYHRKQFSGHTPVSATHHSRRSGSIGSAQAVTPHPLLHTMQSSPSLTGLNNSSQSSLPSTSFPNSTATTRSRGDTLRSIDSTAVPSSARTSMEKAIGFFRPVQPAGPRTPDDTATEQANREAAITAARIAYAEREEAKERKAEKEAMKAADKANKRKQAKEDRQRRRSESGPVSPLVMTTAGPTQGGKQEEGLVGMAYSDHKPVHSRSLPAHVATATAGAQAATSGGISSKWDRNGNEHRSSIRSKWLGFVAWFRTRLLRISSKMRRSSR